jgi:hypothetical protein
MVTAKNVRNALKFVELAGARAAFVLRFSFTTLRQVESYVR